MRIKYRLAKASDALQLTMLFKSVYIYTYGQMGVSTELAKFMEEQFSVTKIKKDLASSKVEMIIATFRGNPIAIVKVEYNKKCPVGGFVAAEINKLYVLSHFIGKGVGWQLLKKAEEFLRKKGEKELWLWVYAKNIKAIRFYEKQQYKHIGDAYFQMEVNRYVNKVMKKEL